MNWGPFNGLAFDGYLPVEVAPPGPVRYFPAFFTSTLVAEAASPLYGELRTVGAEARFGLIGSVAPAAEEELAQGALFPAGYWASGYFPGGYFRPASPA